MKLPFFYLKATGSVVVICAMLSLSHVLWAQCVTPPEVGEWVNIDSNTRSITRINIRFVCQDQVINGELYPPGDPFYVHLFGRCHPSDCDWGEEGAIRIPAGHLYAVYNQGFARRYVYAKMSIYRPGLLWVYVYTNFADPARQDYAIHNWFRKL